MTARFTPITCEEFSASLPDVLERELDDTARAAVEAHALDCDACGSLLSDLRQLSIDAANLPELTPSRDLWDGVAARIDAPVIPIGTRSGEHAAARSRSMPDRRGWRVAGIAASLLLAAALGGAATYHFMRGGTRDSGASRIASNASAVATPAASAPAIASSRGVTSPASTAAPATSGVAATPGSGSPGTSSSRATAANARVVPASNAGEKSAEQTFAAEITRLRVIVNQRRSQLDPITISVIERNLKVIDEAIAQCKAALAKDPASRFLMESLNDALENKVELLRTAAMLPART